MERPKGSLFDLFMTPIIEAIEQYEMTGPQTQTFIKGIIEEGHKNLLADLKADAPRMLREHSTERIGFEERNYARWKEPLDLLMMLFVMCSEISEAHGHEGPGESDPLVFDTLARLQPRGLLVANEIMTLLRAGYADAGLSRWRTLHEILVVASFVAKHGSKAALNYRLSFIFSQERAAKQFNEYSEKARLNPLSNDELRKIQVQCDAAEEQIGCRLKSDWDWAAEFLNNNRPTFFHLEQDVGLDHWRPRVKWASKNIHAAFAEIGSSLAMKEANEVVHLVGPSNSGLADPIHMTSISLMNLTTTFLLWPEPTVDRLVMAKIFDAVVDEIGQAALISDKRTIIDLPEKPE